MAGKAVVVTGASSGNGRAIAHAFARQGADLVLAGRDETSLLATAAECGRLGATAVACPTDVGDHRAVETLARMAQERFGGFGIWVNNAAIMQYGRFEETPPQIVEQVVRTNLLGQMNGAREALRHFRARGRGTLINVSSILGQFGHPYTATYVATKFAILGLTESLRAEVLDAPDIHVCALLPAAIDTPIYQRAANFTGRAVQPIWALYGPEVVARVAVSLARRPRRQAYAGAYGPLVVAGRRLAPGLAENATRMMAEGMELRGEPQGPTPGNALQPVHEGPQLSGGWRERYARAAAPGLALAAVALIAGGAAMTLARRGRKPRAAPRITDDRA